MAPRTILMVGLHDGYARTLSADPGFAAYLLEEPSLYDPDRHPGVPPGRVVLAGYQQSTAFAEPVARLARTAGLHAAVPALEYGVHAAGQIARDHGLPYPGWTAVQACTDKGYLRRLLHDSGIAQPRWRLVQDAAEVKAFHEGRPIVLKPTNGRASEGVRRIDDPALSEAAWQDLMGLDSRLGYTAIRRAYRYIVEDLVIGDQVSVETLYRDGRPVFDNICLMRTGFGDYFPIMSVTVPAPLSPADHAASIAASHRLGRLLAVENGFIHSEWKIAGGAPYLIECAARVPGAFTPELVMHACRGWNMYDAQIRVLSGAPAPVAPAPDRIASITWFRVPPGTVTAVHGADVLTSHPSIVMSRLKVDVGDTVPVMRTGWDRVGYFACTGATWPEVQRVIDEVTTAVRIDVAAGDAR
ncbi:ATP-grasp domain-containing protein [Actinoplanes sp. N902-109]|uniref:ATP-grasp domain-containing protein n=1 Tax=Actinoplanes sp. (strain N902-109) TaxID=649831 RepID=UPI001E5E1442|nr:ATP-grasp domain-containing protein [Actinoplanes sp. N902-109]